MIALPAITQNRRYRYFLFSPSQYKLRTETEESIGKRYIPGQVVSNGRWKDFTEISSSPSNVKFADTVIVAEGYLDQMRYKNASSEWRTRR